MEDSTSFPLIDRVELVKPIEEVLRQSRSALVGFEIYGLRGQGKTRILDEISRTCAALSFPVVLLQFPDPEKSATVDMTPTDLLYLLAQQLDRTLAPAQDLFANAVFEALNPTLPSLETSSEDSTALRAHNAVLILRHLLANALGGNRWALILDNSEFCPTNLFDWIGTEFLSRLLKHERAVPLALFIAGRGRRVEGSQWSIWSRSAIRTIEVQPLDADFSRQHILHLDSSYARAADEIFRLSKGHPYSNQSLVNWLEQLRVSADDVPNKLPNMAKHLLQSVIQEYVLDSVAEEWLLPLLRICCVVRWFGAGELQHLAKHESALADHWAIQWYINCLRNLLNPPLFLISVEHGVPSYRLNPTLRRLLHTIQFMIDCESLLPIHQEAVQIWENAFESLPVLGSQIAGITAVQEILYHTAEIAAIERCRDMGSPILDEEGRQVVAQKTTARLSELLEKHFRPAVHFVPISTLRDCLVKDEDLRDRFPGSDLIPLLKRLDNFVKPVTGSAAGGPFELTHLNIEFGTPPSQYTISWYGSASKLIGEQKGTAPEENIPLDSWFQNIQIQGGRAFRTFIPINLRPTFSGQETYAIQLVTNRTDVPWELLYDDENYLCCRYPIGRLPKTAYGLPSMHRQLPTRPSRRALVIGNPTDDLPEAATEARAVADSLEQHDFHVDRIIGRDACTMTNFKYHVADHCYTLIHYAGHGGEGATNHDPFLMLSDGPFYANYFSRMLNGSPFVFLNACQAGVTREGVSVPVSPGFWGQYLEGLTISLLQGGCRGVLGPIWKVFDFGAKEFALGFYEYALSGKSIGEAVMLARRDMAGRFPDNDYWAPWILYGNPLELLDP